VPEPVEGMFLLIVVFKIVIGNKYVKLSYFIKEINVKEELCFGWFASIDI